MKITGNFSVTEAHQWINLLLNEVPQRVPFNETVTLNYAAFYEGLTQLQASYGYTLNLTGCQANTEFTSACTINRSSNFSYLN